MIGSKSTQSSEQFMTRTGNHSTKPSAKGFGLLGGGIDSVLVLNNEEKRASLVAVWKSLQIQLENAKKEKNADVIAKIGRKISQCGLEINKLRPKKHATSKTGVDFLFINICRETMTKPQFNAIMTEAVRRQNLILQDAKSERDS